MSPRVTRSAARQQAGSVNNPPTDPSPTNTNPPVLAANTTRPPARPRKRKAPAKESSPELQPEDTESIPANPRTKRKRTEQPSEQPQPPQPAPPSRGKATKRRNTTAMSSAGYATKGNRMEEDAADTVRSLNPAQEPPAQQDTSTTPPKRKSKSRKSDTQASVPSSTTTPSSSRRQRKYNAPKEQDDVPMRDAPESGHQEEEHNPGDTEPESDDGDQGPLGRYNEQEDDDMDGDDPFGRYLGRRGGSSAMASTLRALSGMMTGFSRRLRDILEQLRNKEDPMIQQLALQELSEILLVSTEDNLAGNFAPDQYVKELVTLMQPNEFGEENSETMLLACRCLANLMEALPVSTGNVVYGGAVPILCQKLLEIQYIDVAEQALSTLEKISVEFPAVIVREGGLTACLTYLEFFATSTQRTAVTTAANCCRNIPEESFPTVRDVMPILLNVLNSSDQKVVEQGCKCVTRIIESFRFYDEKLEQLVNADLLKAILRLLLPGTTNLIGADIHTSFLKTLAIVAKASPKLSVELLKMNVVDSLYQILTGVSPPSEDEDVATKIDSVVIMQALIHRPRDQIFETLNVICELLPGTPTEGLMFSDDLMDVAFPGGQYISLAGRARAPASDNRRELLKGCRNEVKRFALVLFPTLTDAYSSTVNLSVRTRVLTAQLRMLSNLDVPILEEALKSVPYASHLAAILSQQDHPTLVTYALQAAEVLLKRMENIYRYQFYREGVISEIQKLADKAPKGVEVTIQEARTQQPSLPSTVGDENPSIPDTEPYDGEDDDENEHSEHDGEGEEHPEEHYVGHDDDDRTSSSSSESDQRIPPPPMIPDAQALNQIRAKRFLEVHEDGKGIELRAKAMAILDDLKGLAEDLRRCYSDGVGDGFQLFQHLADYFDGDALESVTSYELLTSNIVEALVGVFSEPDPSASLAKATFLEVFMTPRTTGPTNTPVTPFSVFVHKLQDLLSRSEHFEVITVHQNSYDSNRSSAASMLAKQLRLKLTADDDSGIPKHFRNIMVSIHAIATFKALDDYLRPRMDQSERPPRPRPRDMPPGYPGSRLSEILAGRAGNAMPGPSTAATSATPAAQVQSKKASRSSKKTPPIATPASASNAQEGPSSSSTRRSSRRHAAQQTPPPPPPPPAEASGEPLECADETQITDEEDNEQDRSALNAVVGELEEEEDDDPEDPSAVNMEVAATGKVTARREDGTRVATPLQNAGVPPRTASAARTQVAQQAPSTPTGLSSGRMSYAAAIRAVPQDWHIEFSVNGQPITNDTTIYRAVHFNQSQPEEISARNVWSAIHTISFKRAPGPPPSELSSQTPPPESLTSSGLPQSLDKNPTTSAILRLLSILHQLNSNLDDLLDGKDSTTRYTPEPLSQFVNTKLTAKLNRQLEEPLIVASNCLPTWSEDLARLYPFLFPFETRHLFLQSTSFGYSRSMTRWQSNQTNNDANDRRHRDERPFLGRLQRQKVRISRSRILESAVKVMELYGSSPSMLEVEYFEEVGTGLGPTLEFYSTVSKEFSKKKLKLWRENESNENDEYAFGTHGLFPAPMSEEQAGTDNGKRVLHMFKMLGKFVARSMLDSRIIDVSFNPTFFRVSAGDHTVAPSLAAIKSVDQGLARSLKALKQAATAKKAIDRDQHMSPADKVAAIDAITVDGVPVIDLGLDFTLPGYPTIELEQGGGDVAVTIDNVGWYVEKVIDFTLGSGVQKQVEEFQKGFSQVFPYSALKAFTPDELVMLFGRVEEDWSLETLMDSIKADHGYNLDSKSVRNLLHVMSDLTPAQRRDFLQFVTGSPRLPIGGFKKLTPMFTVVCKRSEPPYISDDYLPSVMTCVNYLKMPDYSNLEILKERLFVAIREGQGAFHLS